MSKKGLSESDICMKFINPAIETAGWDLQTQVRRELTFTDGKVIVRGKLWKRGKKKRADYVLYWKKNLPIAVIEAKDNKHSIASGMQQALGYADCLDVPFVFSSNGDGFQFHDRTGLGDQTESTLAMEEFPSPELLWERYRKWKGLEAAPALEVVTEPYHEDATGKAPRYYQRVAINRTVEAVARGQDRILLVMATGTGKTYTAFQIIWRLWKGGHKKRILFLADRNILVDQTKTNDFKPFGAAMTKVQHRNVDKSYEIYLALYQAVTGTEEEANIYKQFSRDFFDLIVVDECHRSSAREASAWHDILRYFSSATQIGMTATPKETKDVSNITYFGEPVYTYSLKQGIEDGFLAPYKVIRVDIDRDLEGWRPERGAVDDLGADIEDRIYNQKDFDRILVLNKRTKLVAEKVVEQLEANDPYAKTIIFCEDIDHAERMRQAIVNANPERAQEDLRYVMRITGDNPEGKAQLDNFIHPEERYPVIATTSKLMTTGVDARTCKYVVLDQRIQSMTEFKQTIGRGTRLYPDAAKLYFTIIDFKKATELFADPDFDGEPVVIIDDDGTVIEPGEDETTPPATGDEEDTGEDGDEDGGDDWTPIDPTDDPDGTGPTKYYVGDVEVSIVAERVQYYGQDGKLITESLKDYTRRGVLEHFRTLDGFLKTWKTADRKQVILDELLDKGIIIEALQEQAGRDMDPFDLICHIAFGQPPLTRRERALGVKKRDVFTKYGEQARKVLEALLDKYADEGIGPIEKMAVLNVQPFNEMGTPIELVRLFGDKSAYQQAVQELEEALYSVPSEGAA